MATIPDTPTIATALAQVNITTMSSPDIAKLSDAVQRLRDLHTLGGTDESIKLSLLGERDTARAERDARPTAARLAEVEAERDALQAQLDALLAPPPVYSVPIVQFRAGLIPLRLALLSATEQVRAKWAVILPELDVLREVYPREEPVSGLLVEAQNDGLLTAEEVLQLRGGE